LAACQTLYGTSAMGFWFRRATLTLLRLRFGESCAILPSPPGSGGKGGGVPSRASRSPVWSRILSDFIWKFLDRGHYRSPRLGPCVSLTSRSRCTQNASANLRILLVGGVYDKTPAYRHMVSRTPETTLEEGLRRAGHVVVTAGHLSVRTRIIRSADVVHVHHLGAGAVAVASAPVGVPLVFTNHSAPRTLRERLALRFVLSRADAIVSLAHSHRLRPRAGRQRHVVIPNGIDERLFYPVAGEPPPPPPWTLLYAGQLIALKRVDVLVAALRRLRTRYPLRLRIASHSGEASAELHRLVQECNVCLLYTSDAADE